MKEIREAVNIVRQNCYLSSPEIHNALLTLLDLAEKVLAVKMPERSNEPAFYCPMEMLLSESDIINIFNHYFNKMEAKHSKAIMDGDWGTNGSWFTNGEMFNELAKQIHSAQMEKLGGE